MSKKFAKTSELSGHTGTISCIKSELSKKNIFVSGGEDRKVFVWNLNGQNPTALHTLVGHTSAVECVAIDTKEKSNFLAAGSASGHVKIWDLNEEKVVRSFFSHKNNCTTIDIHPISDYIASGSLDSLIKIYDYRTKRNLQTLKSHTKAINFIKFSPDGRFLVSGGEDNVVKLWDVKDGRLVQNFTFHDGHINCFDFHPNELLLATGSSDKTVKFWDLGKCQLIGNTEPETSEIRSVKFSPDGKTLFAGTNNSIKVWGWEPVRRFDTIFGPFPKLECVDFWDKKFYAYSIHNSNIGLSSIEMNTLNPYCVSLKHSKTSSIIEKPKTKVSREKNSTAIENVSPLISTKNMVEKSSVAARSNSSAKNSSTTNPDLASRRQIVSPNIELNRNKKALLSSNGENQESEKEAAKSSSVSNRSVSPLPHSASKNSTFANATVSSRQKILSSTRTKNSKDDMIPVDSPSNSSFPSPLHPLSPPLSPPLLPNSLLSSTLPSQRRRRVSVGAIEVSSRHNDSSEGENNGNSRNTKSVNGYMNDSNLKTDSTSKLASRRVSVGSKTPEKTKVGSKPEPSSAPVAYVPLEKDGLSRKVNHVVDGGKVTPKKVKEDLKEKELGIHSEPWNSSVRDAKSVFDAKASIEGKSESRGHVKRNSKSDDEKNEMIKKGSLKLNVERRESGYSSSTNSVKMNIVQSRVVTMPEVKPTSRNDKRNLSERSDSESDARSQSSDGREYGSKSKTHARSSLHKSTASNQSHLSSRYTPMSDYMTEFRGFDVFDRAENRKNVTPDGSMRNKDGMNSKESIDQHKAVKFREKYNPIGFDSSGVSECLGRKETLYSKAKRSVNDIISSYSTIDDYTNIQQNSNQKMSPSHKSPSNGTPKASLSMPFASSSSSSTSLSSVSTIVLSTSNGDNFRMPNHKNDDKLNHKLPPMDGLSQTTPSKSSGIFSFVSKALRKDDRNSANEIVEENGIHSGSENSRLSNKNELSNHASEIKGGIAPYEQLNSDIKIQIPSTSATNGEILYWNTSQHPSAESSNKPQSRRYQTPERNRIDESTSTSGREIPSGNGFITPPKPIPVSFNKYEVSSTQDHKNIGSTSDNHNHTKPSNSNSRNVAKPIGLDMTAFLPKESKLNVTVEDQDPDVNDLEVIDELEKQHGIMSDIMKSRLANIKLISSNWAKDDMKGAFEEMFKISDHSVAVDVISILCPRPSIFTLEACEVLLPMLSDLLTSQHERYVEVTLRCLSVLLQNFASIIQTTLFSPPAPGVDLQREQRRNRCQVCYNRFVSIIPQLDMLALRGGSNAKLAKEVLSSVNKIS